MQFLRIIISLAGPLFFIWLQGSLVYTAMQMKIDHNQRKLSIIPYLAMLTNCVVWSAYGRMEQELPVLGANMIGILVGIYCTSIYHLYSIYPPLPIYYTMTAVIIICALLLSIFGFVNLVGIIAMLLAITVYGSPLATLQIVLQERSTRSMPFFTSLTAWLTSFSWALYGGIIAKDLMVLVPSIVGVLLASVQLLMYVLYGFDTSTINYTELRSTTSQSAPVLHHTAGIPARGVKSYEMAKQEVKETTPLRESSSYQPSL